MRKELLLTAVGITALFFSPVCAQERPLILVCNDDGIESPGIKALVTEMAVLGEVVVVAPLRNCSGVGHGITYREPINYGRSYDFGGIEAWWVDALPATCVRWGIDTRLGSRLPDLAVSGINDGSNLGYAVYYSGTIGAAREAAIAGIPALAVSMESGEEMDLQGAAARMRLIAEKILAAERKPLLLNINFPSGPIGADRELRLAILTKSRWSVDYHPRESPRGGDYFWITFGSGAQPEDGSDAAVLEAGAISLTPVIVDLTGHDAIEELVDLFGLRQEVARARQQR